MSTLLSPTHITLTSVVSFVVAGMTLLVGSVVLFKGPKKSAHQLFFLMTLTICLWTLTSTLADVVRSPVGALFWAQAAIVPPFIFAGTFLVFSFFFPVERDTMTAGRLAIIFLPVLVALPFVGTPLNVASVRLLPWGTDFTPGPLYPVLLVYMVACLAVAIGNFVLTLRKSADAIIRKQAGLVLVGVGLVVGIGLVTNLILPAAFDYTRASVLGPTASLFFVTLVMYAILRHGLLDVKVIAAELFSATLALVSFIQIFTSDTFPEAVFRVATFSLVLPVAVLLVKSVIQEVRRREEVQILADDLRKANDDLKRIDDLKSEFISIASHQLRTPVSVMKGYLSLIAEGAYGNVSPQMREKIEQIYHMNDRLVHLINNMLNVSRIEKQKMEFICGPFDLVRVANQVVEEMTYKAQERGLELRFVRPEGPVSVYADEDKVAEVLTNVIDNAVKYTLKGSVQLSIEERPKKGGVIVRVADTGIGIPESSRAGIFKKFYRPNREANLMTQGTGLGLYICDVFMRGMGGKIWVERTVENEGTTIAFIVPVTPSGRCVEA